MAGTPPTDPLELLSAALGAPADSEQQQDLLKALRERLEPHPQAIPLLCVPLLQNSVNSEETVFKRWIIDLVQFALHTPTLPLEARIQLSSSCFDSLYALLNDHSPRILKATVQCFAAVYPLMFLFLCSNRTNRSQWDILSQAKARIIGFLPAPNVTTGIKLATLKFMQRVILVQTRGVTDPRLQNKADPNLSFCPSDHPFISANNLEVEGTQLFTQMMTLFFASSEPGILTAIINSLGTMFKLRPGLHQYIVPTFASWTPATLSGQHPSTIKSVEKAARILLTHMARSGQFTQQAQQIGEILVRQGVRMEQAAREAHLWRPPAALAPVPIETPRNTPPVASTSTAPPPAPATAPPPSAPPTFASFDFTTLPVTLVTDLILANLQAISPADLQAAIQVFKQRGTLTVPAPAPTSTAVPASQPLVTEVATPATPPDLPIGSTTDASIKDEPLDPLKMDIDDDDMEFDSKETNLDLDAYGNQADEEDLEGDEAMVGLREFTLPPPRQLTAEEQTSVLFSSFDRVCAGGDELELMVTTNEDSLDGESQPNYQSASLEMWMMMLVRMITRGPVSSEPALEYVETPPAEGSEAVMDVKGRGLATAQSRSTRLRQTLFDYITADFPARVRLASIWMNEEWYNDNIQIAFNAQWRGHYSIWLERLLNSQITGLTAKDKTFSQFLLDLPKIPTTVLNILRDLCVDPDRMPVGFHTLRDFVTHRPPLRDEAMKILLELTTHPEKVPRAAAINTVKRWVPDAKPMDDLTRAFALQMLHRLETNRQTDGMEGIQVAAQESTQTPYIPEHLELPVPQLIVLQHVELLFALTVKVPDFLDAIFAAYGQMDHSVQDAIQHLITALIRSLGSNHGKLLTVLRTFPPAAESLALRVGTILTENGRPSAQLVAIVKGLTAERDLDARFLIPIIAEMDKADIIKHLPRIVSRLNGSPEEKNVVRSVFSSIVTTPPQSFGTVSSNLPRVRQSELLTPAELLVLLHESEKEIGLKSAMEAIGICFSMTDVYRSEILAVVMQQIVDHATLPTLFMRTVIQAVTTYKSLVGYVSGTLLSRLITKKIWMNPPLWDGFIRCAKVIAPTSFGALLQLPKEQLREIVEKHPTLKSGLREYVIKKAGSKARVTAFLEVFGEEGGSKSPTPQPVPLPGTQ